MHRPTKGRPVAGVRWTSRLLAAAALTAVAGAAQAQTTHFGEYTGSATWVVPANVTKIRIRATGGSGMWLSCCSTQVDGGRAGYAEGDLTVTPGETLNVRVGQRGNNHFGGYPGGGDSGAFASAGGGASEVRRGGDTLGNRVIVAGGGGGATCDCPDMGAGGDAGGLSGSDGIGLPGSAAAGGGSQSAGGAAGDAPGTSGASGQAASSSADYVAGGGSGYYGGGSGYRSGGGGGSSYIGGVTGGSTVTADDLAIPYIDIEVLCGDGDVDAGEECDDGNTENGDCCTTTCTAAPAGSACIDEGNSCTSNICNSTGTCLHANLAADTACEADSDVCTTDKCNGSGVCQHLEQPADDSGCFLAPAAQVQIGDGLVNKLKWKWSNGEEFSAPTDTGTPRTSTSYGLCIYDSVAGSYSLKTSLNVAPSVDYWTYNPGKSYRYQDKLGTNGGVTRIGIKLGSDGKTKLQFQAAGSSLALPGPVGSAYFNQSPDVIVQLRNSLGSCWTSRFDMSHTSANAAEQFKASVK